MSELIDLVGKQFGRLTVIKKDELKTRNGGQFYKCKCICGKTKTVGYRYLIRGNTLSCGCLNKENSKKKVQDLKYFKGTQIELISKKTPKKNNSTGVNGVYFDKRLNKYIARIKVKRVQHHLGCFKTLEEARAEREKAEEKYFKPIIEEFEKDKYKK